jgi:hypothetical protein
MASELAIGDQVVCHLKDNSIISIYEGAFDLEFIFDIIAAYDDSYIIYIPYDMFVKDSIYINKTNYKLFNLDKKFIDSYVCRISEHKIARVHNKLDGMCCCKCKQFYSMATANQEDKTLICWSCGKYPSYR